jgi:hypothetical protein
VIFAQLLTSGTQLRCAYVEAIVRSTIEERRSRDSNNRFRRLPPQLPILFWRSNPSVRWLVMNFLARASNRILIVSGFIRCGILLRRMIDKTNLDFVEVVYEWNFWAVTPLGDSESLRVMLCAHFHYGKASTKRSCVDFHGSFMVTQNVTNSRMQYLLQVSMIDVDLPIIGHP